MLNALIALSKKIKHKPLNTVFRIMLSLVFMVINDNLYSDVVFKCNKLFHRQLLFEASDIHFKHQIRYQFFMLHHRV